MNIELIDGLSYEFDYSPDQGIPGCPVCGESLYPVLHTSKWLICEECEVLCDVETEQVFHVANMEPSIREYWLERSSLVAQ
jgi:hypothetical protein